MGSLSGVLMALSGVRELFSGVLAGDLGDTDCSWVTLYMKPGGKNLNNDRDKKNWIWKQYDLILLENVPCETEIALNDPNIIQEEPLLTV